MTPAQLELKRLRELLSGVRKARHLGRAMRTPVARLVRFETAMVQAWNRPLAKLDRVNESHGFEELSPDVPARERVDAVTAWASRLEQLETKVQKRIAALSVSKRLTKAPKPIAERIKGRRVKRAKASAKAQAFERAHKKWAEHVQASAARYLGKMPHEKLVPFLEDLAADASKNDAMRRSAMRHYGADDWADEFLAMAKREPKP